MALTAEPVLTIDQKALVRTPVWSVARSTLSIRKGCVPDGHGGRVSIMAVGTDFPVVFDQRRLACLIGGMTNLTLHFQDGFMNRRLKERGMVGAVRIMA
jgi:hypothetical protein